VLDFVTELTPRYANAHFVRAQILQRLKRPSEAREAYEKAIECGQFENVQMAVDSEISEWKSHNELGVLLISENDLQGALEWLDKGIANRPDAWQLRLNRARVLERLERFSEAEYPSDGLLVEYVNFMLRRGRFTRALETIRANVDLVDPENAVRLLVAAAGVTERIGIPGAEVYLRRALQLSPSSGIVFSAIEDLIGLRGGDPELQKLLEREKLAALDSADDYVRRSHVYLREKNYVEALRVVREGFKRHPDQPMLCFNGALACVQLDGDHEAEILLARVTPAEPEVYDRAMFMLALLLERRGDIAGAIERLENLLVAHPRHPDAALLLGKLSESRGDVAAAEWAYTEARVEGGLRAERELAAFYLRQGRFADAARCAENALAAV
jgi:tetratricopeptide (TPR) repeat protein